MESFGMPRRLLVLGMGTGRQGFNCRPHWSDLALFHQLWGTFRKPAGLREGHSVKETEEQPCPFTVWVSTECYSFLPHPHHASSLAVNHQVSQVLILRSGLWFLKLLISKSERKRYRYLWKRVLIFTTLCRPTFKSKALHRETAAGR